MKFKVWHYHFLIVLIALLMGSSCAPMTPWDRLSARVVELYQQGMYSEATEVAEEAVRIAKKALGPDHPSVATSLNNLALLYKAQGEYAEAEPLHKRALEIWEKALGPDHPNVATVLEIMAELYEDMGNVDEAMKMKKRAEEIRLRNQ